MTSTNKSQPIEIEVNKCICHQWEKHTHSGIPISCDYWDCSHKIQDRETYYLELYPEGQAETFCLKCAAFFMAQEIDYMLKGLLSSQGSIVNVSLLSP